MGRYKYSHTTKSSAKNYYTLTQTNIKTNSKTRTRVSSGFPPIPRHSTLYGNGYFFVGWGSVFKSLNGIFLAFPVVVVVVSLPFIDLVN